MTPRRNRTIGIALSFAVLLATSPVAAGEIALEPSDFRLHLEEAYLSQQRKRRQNGAPCRRGVASAAGSRSAGGYPCSARWPSASPLQTTTTRARTTTEGGGLSALRS